MGQRRLRASHLGQVSYLEGVRLQEQVREAVRAGEDDTLILLEHPHVFTLGRNAQRSDVRADADWLRRFGVEVHECDRGGQVTYHGPGQLVGYPIVNLNPDRRDLRRYVRDLQAALVLTLAELGITAHGGEQASAIGVWVPRPEAPSGAAERKIASIGVHVKRWITTHGFALNVSTDLNLFRGIVACGLPEVRMTSVVEMLGDERTPPMPQMARSCAGNLAAALERQLVWIAPADVHGSTEPSRAVHPAAAPGEAR